MLAAQVVELTRSIKDLVSSRPLVQPFCDPVEEKRWSHTSRRGSSQPPSLARSWAVHHEVQPPERERNGRDYADDGQNRHTDEVDDDGDNHSRRERAADVLLKDFCARLRPVTSAAAKMSPGGIGRWECSLVWRRRRRSALVGRWCGRCAFVGRWGRFRDAARIIDCVHVSTVPRRCFL